MTNENRALVVMSGGQDSTTCLLWALHKYRQVEAITFDYGQRHAKEIEQAIFIGDALGVNNHTVLDMNLLNQLAPNALTRSDIEVKVGENGGLPSTFVDGRNMLFLTFAAVMAKQKGIKHIITGVCETDFSGYPDCRDVFVKSLNVTLNLAMDYEFVIHTPLMWLDKAQTWKMADEFGMLEFVRNNTVTCYHGVPGDGCGTCPSCVLRNKGLQQYLESKVKKNA